MSNNGDSGTQLPAFVSGTQENPSIKQSVIPPVTRGWDNAVAAVRSASKDGQALLLTLTADNFSPIWIDLYTKRYFTENDLYGLPQETVSPKLYAKVIDPQDPPFPWVDWRPIDTLLWAIGKNAFSQRKAKWLIPGERYSLMRWPNLTQIPYGPEELNAVSMLANGLLTVDELSLVTELSPEKSRQLVSTLSFMGVLRGTGASHLPPEPTGSHDSQNLFEAASRDIPELGTEAVENSSSQDFDESILDKESSTVLADAARFKSQLTRPAISSMSLPSIPESMYHPEEEVALPEAAEPVNVPQEIRRPSSVDVRFPPLNPKAEAERQSSPPQVKSYREETAARFSSMPSFESILAQQSVENAAVESMADDEAKTAETKPSGLFGMLKKWKLR